MRLRPLPALFAASLLTFGCSPKDEAKVEAPKTGAAGAAQTAEPPAVAEKAAEAPPKPEPTTPEGQLKARLYGDWHLDLKSLGDTPDFKHLPPQQKEQAVAMAQRMLADVSFSFGEDGRIALGFGPARRSGTYVVDRVEGNRLEITATVGEGDDATVEKVLLRIEGDAMWVTEGDDNRTLRLLRGKPPEAPASQPAAGSQPTAPASQPMRMPAPGRMPAGHPGGGMPAGHPGTAQPAQPAPGGE